LAKSLRKGSAKIKGKTYLHIYHNAERHPLGTTWPWGIYPIIEGKTRKPGKVRVAYEKFTGVIRAVLSHPFDDDSDDLLLCREHAHNDWVWDAEGEGWVCRDSEGRRVHFAIGR
jgi:hypothetical protein